MTNQDSEKRVLTFNLLALPFLPLRSTVRDVTPQRQRVAGVRRKRRSTWGHVSFSGITGRAKVKARPPDTATEA